MPTPTLDPVRCRHIHSEGRQCGSPALRHEKLCYHHHAARRPLARRPGDPLGPILPDPEDLPAVQRGLAELLRLVARELIDDKQAKLLFALLTEAGTNLARLDRARVRQRALDLAEARFAARHPEAAALAAARAPQCVIDLVSDPELGAIAPPPSTESSTEPSPNLSSTPEPSPESSTPDLLPAFARDRPDDVQAHQRRVQAEAEAAAKVEAEFQRIEEENREERRSLREAAQQVYRQLGWTHRLIQNSHPYDPEGPANEPADREPSSLTSRLKTVDHPASPLEC